MLLGFFSPEIGQLKKKNQKLTEEESIDITIDCLSNWY